LTKAGFVFSLTPDCFKWSKKHFIFILYV